MAQWATVAAEVLNLRQAPNTSAPIIRELKKGEVLEVTNPNPGFDWLGVRVDATRENGFISKLYAVISDIKPGTVAPTPPLPPINPTPAPVPTPVTPIIVIVPFGTDKATVMTALLNVRGGPGTNFDIVTKLPQNTIIDVSGTSGDWAQIRYQGVMGYVARQFISMGAPVKQGYLREQPELFEVRLTPDRILPPQQAKTAVDLAARTWNNYGGLITRLAIELNIPQAAMVGVLVAESGGNAFASDGRMIIRFENHIFFQYWGRANPDAFFRHFQFDQTSPATGFKLHKFRPTVAEDFQAFHGDQNKEWAVLNFARSLGDTAALQSISMGAPQIMGFNFKRVGYESVQQMYENFARSAHAQLIGLFDFVREPMGVSRAMQALQANDYLTFASIYNGPANAQTYAGLINGYANAFSAIINSATVAPVPVSEQRGPEGVSGGAGGGTGDSVVAPIVIPPPAPVTPPVPIPPPVVVVDTAAAPPPATAAVIVVPTDPAGLNIRSVAGSFDPSTILARLPQGEPVTALESLEAVRAKLGQSPEAKQYINVRTDKGVVGFGAAWLLALAGTGSALPSQSVDDYINGIPDRFEVPAGVDTLRAQADRIGLPDPFDVLPIQVRTTNSLVNLPVNGFGPNTFSAINWATFYKFTGGMHNGLDFIVATGTPLQAVADGVIIRDWPFMGDVREKTVVLWAFMPDRFRDSAGRRLLSNTLVAYAHLSNNTLRADQEVVKAGDIIGISGTPAGQLTNDHLHMEVHLLSGERNFPTIRNRRLLKFFKGDQPNDNSTPFNPLLFFSRRMTRYLLDRMAKGGFGGRAAYPTPQEVNLMGLGGFPVLDAFSVAYYRYGTASVWTPSASPFGTGVALTTSLAMRLASFPDFTPYSSDFLGH